MNSGVRAPGQVRPRVLMVTGAFYPELSGGGLQARAVVQALQADVDFAVLTTSIDPALPSHAEEAGVPIRRVYVNLFSAVSRALAGVRLAAAFFVLARRSTVVNLHGFSRKAILFVALSRLLRKPFMLTLHTAGHDEPATVRAMGRFAFWAYAGADLYTAVSPALSQAYRIGGLPTARLRQIGNAIDVERFRPPAAGERRRLRTELGLPADVPLVIFVGFFSREKRPDLLYEAWSRLERAGHAPSALLFVGATRGGAYREVDPAIADGIRQRAAADGLSDRVLFVESTHAVDAYFRAADLFVLPSVREGSPLALLEAMATGLPCIASRLPGSTDDLIDDGVNGRLVAPDAVGEFAEAIASLVGDRQRAAAFGAAARATVVARHSIAATARCWSKAYTELSEAHAG